MPASELYPPTSAFWVADITDMHFYAWPQTVGSLSEAQGI
jgi:hypothetical protein